jgi:electron transfer flavoprotein beta subunit
VIAACLKWVDLRPEVDPLDAHVRTDARTAGLSAADAAALEWALRAGDRWGQPVLAVTAGSLATDRVLRDAIAAGAARAVRVDVPDGLPSVSVALALAEVLRPAPVTTVFCGDHSLDRGSGSVPAFLAAELGLPQALGLVDVDLHDDVGHAVVGRRLDRGRRERVRLAGSGVLSVEGSTARLRRAPLRAVMDAGTTPLEVVAASPVITAGGPLSPPTLHPYRPRARVLPGPAGSTALDRIAALTQTGNPARWAEVLMLDPPAAAEQILDALAAWGELER